MTTGQRRRAAGAGLPGKTKRTLFIIVGIAASLLFWVGIFTPSFRQS